MTELFAVRSARGLKLKAKDIKKHGLIGACDRCSCDSEACRRSFDAD